MRWENGVFLMAQLDMEQDLSRALNIGDFGGFVLTAKLALSSFFTTPISVIAKHGMAERL